jgi:hypothetical protein
VCVCVRHVMGVSFCSISRSLFCPLHHSLLTAQLYIDSYPLFFPPSHADEVLLPVVVPPRAHPLACTEWRVHSTDTRRLTCDLEWYVHHSVLTPQSSSIHIHPLTPSGGSLRPLTVDDEMVIPTQGSWRDPMALLQRSGVQWEERKVCAVYGGPDHWWDGRDHTAISLSLSLCVCVDSKYFHHVIAQGGALCMYSCVCACSQLSHLCTRM